MEKKIENDFFCPCCDRLLTVEEIIETDEDGKSYYMSCTQCGTRVNMYIPGKEEREGEFSDYWKGGVE